MSGSSSNHNNDPSESLVSTGGPIKIPFFYGWVIVAVSMVSLAFWFGIRTSFSVFFLSMVEDFGWKRAEAAGVQSLALLVYGLMSPVVGGLVDRWGPRRVVFPGVLVLALGFFLCGKIETIGQFYLYYGLLAGLGIACVGLPPYTAVLAHWFSKKRGLAGGLMVSGMGVGILFFVPLIQIIIKLWSWRDGFLVLAAGVLVVLAPLTGLFLRHRPQEMGLLPDGRVDDSTSGEKESEPGGNPGPRGDWTLSAAMKTVNFWALLIFPFLVLVPVYTILVHYVPLLVDHGIDRSLAAYTFALVGVFSTISRIFWGWLSDRIGREWSYTLGLVPFCLGLIILILFEQTEFPALIYIFVFLFGCGWGVVAPMIVVACTDIFYGRIVGLIFGLVEGILAFGGALGTLAAGWIYDRTMSYTWALVLGIIFLVLSGVGMWIAAPRRAVVIRRRFERR